MRYDTLLFDADDTLLDFKLAEKNAFFNTMSIYGIVPDDNIFLSYSIINSGLWKMLENKLITRNELKIRRFADLARDCRFTYNPSHVAETYANELSKQSYLLGNALEVCTKLSESCRLYLITNGFRSIQSGRFENSPLAKLFSGVFISEDIGYNKPEIRFFDAVSASIPNFKAAKALIIGDSLTSDIQGGINAGIDVCWFNPSHKTVPKHMHINYIISNLSELYEITK